MRIDAHPMRIGRCIRMANPIGYSAILSDNEEVDADIRIRMAIPSLDV